jgi:VWFA-related protein
MKRCVFAVAMAALTFVCATAAGQKRPDRGFQSQKRNGARPVTIPVTIIVRKSKQPKEVQPVDLMVREDGDIQSKISFRLPKDAPLTLALLIQDDLVSSIATEARTIANFIRHLPPGSRVMVGYIRSGSLDVRRKFTNELEKAAAGVRPPMGLASAGPYNPYVEITEALHRFDSQPTGRRAIVVVSDGLDVSRGIESSSPAESLDLQHAISEAQRRGVAIYSLYAPSASAGGNQSLLANGQSSLERLSSDTGGHAYFQGTGAPVSFDPFLNNIADTLGNQIALTYLSTHTKKGFHRLEIKPLDDSVEVRYPSGSMK